MSLTLNEVQVKAYAAIFKRAIDEPSEENRAEAWKILGAIPERDMLELWRNLSKLPPLYVLFSLARLGVEHSDKQISAHPHDLPA